ncbi:MAG: hypothetical protein A2V70_16665 [Planctomycetes bacterium RBG_13_63_9]|nr:MAG: hypothetical protein A2V70_16665 [Planctomycetes bacterium RBG_13_63_9]
MNDKKKASDKNQPEHVIRSGEVRAVICHRQSNAGYAYLDFSLSRCWNSMATGKEAHGNSFFDRHEDDLIRAVREAAAWIRTNLQSNFSQKDLKAADKTQ